MSSVIRLLPDHVANQIAAGEVVQRPASVVKELLENSVDAGATSIKLVVKDAGKSLIQVIDNGKGMNEVDARVCFERHATSKISSADDLFQLQTKGFRGEALASIAAIAHVELATKTKDADLGTKVVIEGSKITSQTEAVLPDGTSFSVKNLFFNIPARRNFLKSDQVEMRHIVDEFERVALAHPQIQFSLISNGAEMFQLPISNLRQRVVNVFGGKTNEKLVPVCEQTEMVKIDGFVGKPEFAKRSRGEQFFFVNNRYIKSSYLHHAVTAAFEGLLKDGTHPSYFLYLELPAHTIDINIHPTKTEIKFEDEKALYAILRASIKHSLGQFQVAPVLDFQRNPELDLPYEMEGTQSKFPTIAIDPNFNPFESQEKTPSQIFNPFESDLSTKTKSQSFNSGKSSGYSGKPNNYTPSHSHWETLYQGISDAKGDILNAQLFIEKEVEQDKLFHSDQSASAQSQVSFQMQRKYIVQPIKSGLMIIDQRRAHQRILYDEYLRKLSNNFSSSQQLLFPLALYFTPSELALFGHIKDYLYNMGFVFDEVTNEKITISGIPVGILESEVSMIIDDLMSELQEETWDEVEIISHKIALSMAQSLAIKSGTILNKEEQENIINHLFACSESSVSPFGKNIFTVINLDEIDRKFL